MARTAQSNRPAPAVAGPSASAVVDLRLFDDVDVADLDADGALGFSDGQDAVADTDTVVVHVQLRPRQPATRRCLVALAALATQHPEVSFALTGLSKDARVVRVTVGIALGPRESIARFSAEAQAAYAFVDGMFTQLYDYMPVYVGQPSEPERAAADEVVAALSQPSPRVPQPRIPAPRMPIDSLRGRSLVEAGYAGLVPAPRAPLAVPA